MLGRAGLRRWSSLLRGKWSLRRSAGFWDVHNLGGDEDVLYWLAVPILAQEINRRVSGDPGIWPLTAFVRSVRRELPVERALSVGCGTGNLERELLRAGGARQIDGIDVSGASVDKAQELAERSGLGRSVSYHRADAVSWLKDAARRRGYDLIFFHGSLHHIEALEEVLSLSAQCLREGRPGLLYMDEYVGPSRHQWQPSHLGFANGLFARIPAEDRRIPQVLPPLAVEDPTEMIRSSEIEGLLRDRFAVADYRPYYGNVLFPLVSAIHGKALTKPAVLRVLREGIDLENYLIGRRLLETLYAVIVARPQETV